MEAKVGAEQEQTSEEVIMEVEGGVEIEAGMEMEVTEVEVTKVTEVSHSVGRTGMLIIGQSSRICHIAVCVETLTIGPVIFVLISRVIMERS